MILFKNRIYQSLSELGTVAFVLIEREFVRLGLAVSEDKTKHMLSTYRDVRSKPICVPWRHRCQQE